MYVKKVGVYRHTYTYSYDQFALLYSRNQQNNVKQLFQAIFLNIYALWLKKKKKNWLLIKF